jgi:TPP-dependent pyruvate/acetoin dehydrogenase alpha subunit
MYNISILTDEYVKPLTREDHRRMHYLLVLTRRFEETLEDLLREKKLIGGYHFGIGQEAIQVGACYKLREDDLVMPSLRDRGVFLIKGVPTREMLAGCYGKSTGCGGGRWGHHHAPYKSKGVLAGSGVIGADISIATGAALAAKIKGKSSVVLDFFGDGASNTGNFHEAVNMAASLRLPIVYICENNQYAISMPWARASAVRDIALRALGYGVPGLVKDGNNVLEVYSAVKCAVERARAGLGPSLIEMKTYSWRGHNPRADSQATFRPIDEREEWEKNDPIGNYEHFLLHRNLILPEEIYENRQSVEGELVDAVHWAEEQPFPKPEETFSDRRFVFSDYTAK